MRAIIALAVALVLALGLSVPGPVTATTPGGNGKIVFVEYPDPDDVDGVGRLAVINPDGSGRTTITDGADSDPDWSPDGTKIAFTRWTPDDGSEIFVAGATGSNPTSLTSGEMTGAMAPAWSPDGTRIAYTRLDHEHDLLDVWVMDADGSNEAALTVDGGSRDPIWSPDGRRIHFDSAGLRYSMAPDGSDIREDPGCQSDYDWFPSMERLACTLVSGSWPVISSEVVSVRPDGSGPIYLTSDQTFPGEKLGDSSVSPDGRRVVISNWSVYPVPHDLYILNTDGSGTAFNLTKTTDVDEALPDWQPSPPYRFSDIAGNPFRADIEWLAAEGIASGCGGTRFCPTASVTRGQMASFLARSLALPGTATDYFSDDETSIHETDINKVAAAGIASGCGAGKYCPTATVTRAQMASFLARAFSLPSSATDYFSDDEASVHEADINRVAKAGITSGCTATTYCPASPVTRGQMAAFLHRALD